jgi:uncharacterized membrane protein
MLPILVTISFWLHAVATVIMIGHYLLLALIYLPVLGKSRPDNAGGSILSEISKQSRLWLYLSLLVFTVTGIYLTVVDPNYLGIGDFGNICIHQGKVEHHQITQARCAWQIHSETSQEWVIPDVDGRCIPTKTGAEIPIIQYLIARLCQPTIP